MQQSTINKFNKIFEKFEELRKGKEVRIWSMGTSFLLYIKRFGFLLEKIYNDFGIEDISNIDYINIVTKEGKSLIEGETLKVKKRYFLNIECKLTNGEVKESSLSFKNNTWNNVSAEENDKLMSETAYGQIVEVWTSMGFISQHYKSSKNGPFDILYLEKRILSDIEIMELINSKIELSWDAKSSSLNSIRDIAFTIIFTAYFLGNGKILSTELEEAMGDHKVNFKSKKGIGYEELIKNIMSPTSSLKKQTWARDINEEMFMIIEKMLNFIYEKALNDWEVSKDSFEVIQLLSYMKESNSSKYAHRILMANANKRFDDEERSERHDIISGIKSLELVEAVYILDYQDCLEEQKYDPENGLLIDPTLSKWFKKKLITFDENGEMYMSRKYKEEIGKVLKDNINYKIRNNILTEGTKEYIRIRNNENYINLNNFDKFE